MNFLKRFQTNTLVMIGNTLEYYDLYLYIHLAFLINKHFFPDIEPDNQILKIFSLVSMYFVAPLASIFWGIYGDLIGRKKVLILGSFLMAFSTSIIMIIPNYNWWPESLKIMPIFLLFILRILQGIAIAGEPLAAKLYSIENLQASKKDENIIISKIIPMNVATMSMTQSVGGMIALGIAGLSINFLSWEHAWRIPFIVAFLSCGFIFYLRFFVSETKEYINAPFNKRFSILNTEEIRKHFNSLRFSKVAFFACAILCFSYPCIFVFNFTVLSPIVVKKFGYTQEFLINYNFIITFFEFLFTYLTVYIPIKLNFDKKITMLVYHVIVAVCMLTFYFGKIDKDLPLWYYITLQIFMISFVNWNLIFGSIIKSLPVLQRFTQMSLAFAIGKLITFFLSILIVPYFCGNENIQNYCLILLVVLGFSMIAVCFYIPYEKSDYTEHLRLKKHLAKLNM